MRYGLAAANALVGLTIWAWGGYQFISQENFAYFGLVILGLMIWLATYFFLPPGVRAQLSRFLGEAPDVSADDSPPLEADHDQVRDQRVARGLLAGACVLGAVITLAIGAFAVFGLGIEGGAFAVLPALACLGLAAYFANAKG